MAESRPNIHLKKKNTRLQAPRTTGAHEQRSTGIETLGNNERGPPRRGPPSDRGGPHREGVVQPMYGGPGFERGHSTAPRGTARLCRSQSLHVRAHHSDQIFMAGQFDAETTREAARSRSEDKRSCVA